MGDYLCRGLMRVYKSSSSLNNKGKINWLWQFGHGDAIWGSSAHCIFCNLYGAFCFLLLSTQFKNNSIILHFPLSCKYYRIFSFLFCIAKISKQLKLNYYAEKPNEATLELIGHLGVAHSMSSVLKKNLLMFCQLREDNWWRRQKPS